GELLAQRYGLLLELAEVDPRFDDLAHRGADLCGGTILEIKPEPRAARVEYGDFTPLEKPLFDGNARGPSRRDRGGDEGRFRVWIRCPRAARLSRSRRGADAERRSCAAPACPRRSRSGSSGSRRPRRS